MPKATRARSTAGTGRSTAPAGSQSRTLSKHSEVIIDVKLRILRGESIPDVSTATGMSVSSVRRFLGLVRPDPRQSATAHEELQAKLERLQVIAEERFAGRRLESFVNTPVAVVCHRAEAIAERKVVVSKVKAPRFSLVIPVKRKPVLSKPASPRSKSLSNVKIAIVEPESESESESDSEESENGEWEVEEEEESKEEGADVEMASESETGVEGGTATAASIRDEVSASSVSRAVHHADSPAMPTQIHLGNLLVISYTSDRVVAPDGQLRKTRIGPCLLPAYEALIEARQDNSISIRARGPSYRTFLQAVLDFRTAVQVRDGLSSLPSVAELSAPDQIRILASSLLFRLYHFKASPAFIRVWNSPEEYESAVEAALESNESLLAEFNSRYAAWADCVGVKAGGEVESEGNLSLSGEARKRLERLSGQMRARGCSAEEEAAIKGMAGFADISVGSAYGSGDNVRWWAHWIYWARARRIVEGSRGSALSASVVSKVLAEKVGYTEEERKIKARIVKKRNLKGNEENGFGGFGQKSLRHRLALVDLFEVGILSSFSGTVMSRLVNHGSKKGLASLVDEATSRRSKRQRRTLQPHPSNRTSEGIPLFATILDRFQDLAKPKSNCSKRARELIKDGGLDTVGGLEHTLCKYSKMVGRSREEGRRAGWDIEALGIAHEELYLVEM